MSALILCVLLIVNFAISSWNAYVAGVIWREAIGWMKLVAVSAVVMSVCGFVSVLGILYGFLAKSMGWIDAAGFHALVSLEYLFIIFPVLGAGLVITIHSWIEAYKRRDFASVATAGWNTVAQGMNTYDAMNGGVSTAWDAVSRFFKSDDEDASPAQIAVLFVFLAALASSVGLTLVFFILGRKHALASPQQMAYSRQSERRMA